MGAAWMRRLAASVAISLLGLAHVAYAQQGGNGNTEDPNYLAQHFSFEALNPDVQAAITRANLPPVSFQKIVLHTRDVVSSPDQPQPSTYSSTVTLENAGHGLVRRVEAVQDNSGSTTATRLDLTYHGYFSFLTQGIPAQATSIPPMQETRKVLRLDTGTSGHAAFVYLYGSTGEPTFQDPGQFLCDSGKSYSAAQLNPSIEGQALEMNCRIIDTNGIESDKVTLAYLEKYGVAVTLHAHNQQRTVVSSILDFNAR